MQKIAEVRFELDTGATVVDYIRFKSNKALGKRLEKLMAKKTVDLGAIKIDRDSVMTIDCKFHGVH